MAPGHSSFGGVAVHCNILRPTIRAHVHICVHTLLGWFGAVAMIVPLLELSATNPHTDICMYVVTFDADEISHGGARRLCILMCIYNMYLHVCNTSLRLLSISC